MSDTLDPATPRVRARELGLPLGRFRPGKFNAITDVAGVLVGHTTLIEGEGPLRPGHGPVRTGVTAIVPGGGDIFMERLHGGGFVLNGAGEVSGLTQVMEWGLLETPILLTNTMSVGVVSDAMARIMVEQNPGIGDEHDVIIPVVGECDDSWLNDITGRHVREEHVRAAVALAASGAVGEGSVGGGTGMVTCDFKAGIGTSSRKLPETHGGYTLGVLVMSNFGKLHNLRFGGLPLGEALEERFAEVPRRGNTYGSIIAVVATDAPLFPHQCQALARRVTAGLARTGTSGSHFSGDLFLAFTTASPGAFHPDAHTAQRLDFIPWGHLDPFYEAVVQATEEAVINALVANEEMTGRDGHRTPALPRDRVVELVAGVARRRLPFIQNEPR